MTKEAIAQAGKAYEETIAQAWKAYQEAKAQATSPSETEED